MFFPIRKIIFNFIFNLSLFGILIIGIQNSSDKNKINFLLKKQLNYLSVLLLALALFSVQLQANS